MDPRLRRLAATSTPTPPPSSSSTPPPIASSSGTQQQAYGVIPLNPAAAAATAAVAANAVAEAGFGPRADGRGLGMSEDEMQRVLENRTRTFCIVCASNNVRALHTPLARAPRLTAILFGARRIVRWKGTTSSAKRHSKSSRLVPGPWCGFRDRRSTSRTSILSERRTTKCIMTSRQKTRICACSTALRRSNQ